MSQISCLIIITYDYFYVLFLEKFPRSFFLIILSYQSFLLLFIKVSAFMARPIQIVSHWRVESFSFRIPGKWQETQKIIFKSNSTKPMYLLGELFRQGSYWGCLCSLWSQRLTCSTKNPVVFSVTRRGRFVCKRNEQSVSDKHLTAL